MEDKYRNRQDDDSSTTNMSDDQEIESAKDGDQKESSYYVYGSYQSGAHHKQDTLSHDEVIEKDLEDNHSQVEITRPAPVQHYEEPHSFTWQASNKNKRGSSFKSMFVSFLIGAMVVALFVFAADQMNLFQSNTDNLEATEPVVSQGDHSGASGIRTAAAEGVVRPNTISDIVKLAGPAVVKIETKVSQASTGRFNDDIFRWFFGDQYQSPQQPEQQDQLRPGGMGSGFIFEKNGYILTNQHVIDGAEEIWVELEGHKDAFRAELLGSDYEMDLAVLKIEGKEPFPTLKIGNSTDMEVGDWVTAIGNPIGFDHTVSVGVLSAKGRQISIPDDKGRRGPRMYEQLLQTDASINPGNSGGPLLNLNAEVIGMNTAISANAQGIGFAIPSSTLLEVVDRLKEGEDIEKPFIGITLTNLDEAIARELKLESNDGVVVMQVLRDSPASRAGLKPYDVVTEFNGEKVTDVDSFQAQISKAGVGARATLTFVRDGKPYDTGIIIGDRNSM